MIEGCDIIDARSGAPDETENSDMEDFFDVGDSSVGEHLGVESRKDCG